MQVTENKNDGLTHELKVVLSRSEIDEKLEYRLRDLSRTVTVPGFRRGKVPMAMLKKRFGQSVMGEILESAITDGSSQAIMERGLKPAMQPKIEVVSFEDDKDLEFTIEVEVLPAIEPMDFAKLELERVVVEVGDGEVDSALEHLATQHKDARPVAEARKTATGDIVHIDFVGRIGGEEFPGGTAEAYRLELGSNAFVPGFEDQLIGLEAGAKKDVAITFPEDYGNAELAGKEAVFEVQVKELLESVPAAIDDELARKAGADDLASLRAQLREQIEEEYAEMCRGRLKRGLLDRLAEHYDFDVPPGMLDQEFDSVWKQIKDDLDKGEAPDEDAGKDEEALKLEYRAIALRRVRLGLVLSDIGERHGVQVTQDEVTQAIMEEARRFPGREREVLDHYHGDPEAAAALRAPIFENKVVDLIVEQAKVVERRLTVADLVAEIEAGDKAAPKSAKPKKAAKAKKKTPAKKAPPKSKSKT